MLFQLLAILIYPLCEMQILFLQSKMLNFLINFKPFSRYFWQKFSASKYLCIKEYGTYLKVPESLVVRIRAVKTSLDIEIRSNMARIDTE